MQLQKQFASMRTGFNAVRQMLPQSETNGNYHPELQDVNDSYMKNKNCWYCPSIGVLTHWSEDLAHTDENWDNNNIGYYYWSCKAAHSDTPPFAGKMSRCLTLRDSEECWVMSDVSVNISGKMEHLFSIQGKNGLF